MSQAAELSRTLRDVALSAVVASPMARTVQTAEPIASAHGMSVEPMEMLTDYEFGAWTGRPISQMEDCPGWRRFNEVRSLSSPPGGELMVGLQLRALSALLDLRARYPSGTVLAVTHADVIRAVLIVCLGMPMDFVHRLEIGPACINIVELGDGAPRVTLVNGSSGAVHA
jgi:broad specificity phosphatase PhoE